MFIFLFVVSVFMFCNWLESCDHCCSLELISAAVWSLSTASMFSLTIVMASFIDSTLSPMVSYISRIYPFLQLYLFKKSIQCIGIRRFRSPRPFVHFDYFLGLDLRRFATVVSTLLISIISRCIWCNWRCRWMWWIINVNCSGSIRYIISSVVVIIIRMDSRKVCTRVVPRSRSRSSGCICVGSIAIVGCQASGIIAGWMIFPMITAAWGC